MSSTSDLAQAAQAIEKAKKVVETGVAHLASTGGPDVHQQLAYDLAHSAAAVETARSMLDYGSKGETEALLTCAFTADMIFEVSSRLLGREHLWGLEPHPLEGAYDFMATFRDPVFVASLAEKSGPRHLDDDFEMVQDTFRSFASKVIAPRAEHVHRFNEDVPEEVIAGLADLGAFGLSVPSEYGGFSEGGDGEYMANCIATEELSRASLGIGG